MADEINELLEQAVLGPASQDQGPEVIITREAFLADPLALAGQHGVEPAWLVEAFRTNEPFRENVVQALLNSEDAPVNGNPGSAQQPELRSEESLPHLLAGLLLSQDLLAACAAVHDQRRREDLEAAVKKKLARGTNL